MQRGHFDEAIQFWSQTLAINPAMVLLRANLAAALFRIGQAEQARAVIRKALEFNPSFQAARDFLEPARSEYSSPVRANMADDTVLAIPALDGH